jgi:hypothetical protein
VVREGIMNDVVMGRAGGMSGSVRWVVAWIPTVLALLIAGYFSVGAAIWCWEGAYNVLQGDSPDYGFFLALLVAGLLPLAAPAAYCYAMRRSGQARRSSLAYAAFVALVTSFFVLAFRAGAAGGF